MTTKHVHDFTRSRPTSAVDTCACGKFRHNENNKSPIITELAPATNTPTPWVLNDPIKTEIVSGYGWIDISVARDLRPADAAFIVRAVNAHEELLTAAERVRSVLNDEGKEILTKREMEDLLFEAIARAEGK